MDLAVMAYSFSRALEAGELDLPAVIRWVHDLGISQIELRDDQIVPDAMPAVRQALVEVGMSVPCFNLHCDVASPDSSERAERLARVRDRLAPIAALGVRQVLVVPGLAGDVARTPLARQWFCEALRALLPEASRLGIALTIENLGILAELYGRSESILAICEEVGPQLKVTFDAGNFLLAGEDNRAAFDRLAPRVTHVHFKDWQVVSAVTPASYPGVDGRCFQGAPLGEGVVDLHGVVARLQALAYRGTIAVEYEGPDNPTECVRRGVSHLRTLLASCGRPTVT
jgi:sugar phosphate isomerase/epimerase